MSIEKLHNGAWRISDMINGYLVQHVYYFYSKREAMAMFRQMVKEMKR
jgi:hypothetical protein